VDANNSSELDKHFQATDLTFVDTLHNVGGIATIDVEWEIVIE
jgi:hypothetical protein